VKQYSTFENTVGVSEPTFARLQRALLATKIIVPRNYHEVNIEMYNRRFESKKSASYS